MNTNKLYSKHPFLALVAVLLLVSCSQENYMRYDSSYNGLYFTADSLTYSFSVTPVETRTHSIQIPVKMMGVLSDQDREIPFKVMADSTTAIEGKHYQVGSHVIKADSIYGNISIILLRDGLEGSYATGYTRYRLSLRLASNDYFVPTLQDGDQFYDLKFDNSIEQPSWLDYKGDKVWYVSNLGTWHPFTFIKLVEFFHSIEEIMPETYVNMVSLYGENLEHVPYGSFHDYSTIVRKYMLKPMYDYVQDPANHDYIYSLYPDYPFDFPDPYKATTGIEE